MSKDNSVFALDSITGKWTLLACVLASSMAFIDSTALNIILPSLQVQLAASATDLFWVQNSYLLILAAVITVAGSLGDNLGRVKVFKVGIIIFTFSSALCGFSQNIDMLIAFRILQGFGGALMIPGSLSIISSIFSENEKGTAIGTWSSITTVVTISGPLLGGVLADFGLWRYIFFINIPLGITSYFILRFKVPESSNPESKKIDWIGALLLTAGLACITYGLLKIPALGLSHIIIVLCISSGIFLIFIFLWYEGKINYPMIPLSIFNSRVFSGLNLLTFFLYGGINAISLFLSLNIIQIQGYSQLQAGLTFLPFSFSMLLLSKKMGSLTDRFGFRRFLIIGPIITGIGLLWISQLGKTAGPASYWYTFMPPYLFFAFGMGITVVPLTTAIMKTVDSNLSGVASGINNSITRISATIISALFGAMALNIFSNHVLENIKDFNLSNETIEIILQESKNFGEAKAPIDLSAALTHNILQVYQDGFLVTFEIVGILCSGLAFLSSIIAWIMIKDK